MEIQGDPQMGPLEAAESAGQPTEAEDLLILEGSDQPDEETRTAPDHLLTVGQRLWLPIAVFTILLLAVVVRLAQWQLPLNRPGKPAVSVPTAVVEPARGHIVDRNGILLATDGFRQVVWARPSDIYSSTVAETVVVSLTKIFDQPLDSLAQKLPASQPLVSLSQDATNEQCDAVRAQIGGALEQPGLVWCDWVRERDYPQGGLGAHLLGFVNSRREGVYGVEASYDDWLRTDGNWPSNSLTGTAMPLPDAWKLYLPSAANHDLVLYLDAPLQYVVERILRQSLDDYQAESGTIIVMDPRTGGIYALAIYPAFDPNHYSDVEPKTWVNSAVSEVYEPGSVFKVVTMSAALDSGRITPETVFEDTGALTVNGQTIHNAENMTYGLVTATEALAHSINVVSAQMSLSMGPEVFYSYLRRFGFSKLTELDLRNESAGIVKERGQSDWSPYDEAANSFGQGISVTPIQMINAVAAIANGGVLLQPHVARAMVQDGVVYEVPPHIIGRPVRPDTAQKMKDMMVYDVTSSSYADFLPGYSVAGKTGTAEIPTPEGYVLSTSITSFIGFLPADNPQLVIMVKLDKPLKSRWAEQVAVPVFAQVANEAIRILGVGPY